MANTDTGAQPARMTWSQRVDHEARVREAAVVDRDFPLLPTSDTDATPTLAAEENDNLSPGQRLAVAALVSGQTFVAAARAASVSRRTLFQWRQEPDFQRAVESRSREALDVVVVRVRNLMLRATRVLGESMMQEKAGPVHAFRLLNSRRIWEAAESGAGAAGGEGGGDAT